MIVRGADLWSHCGWKHSLPCQLPQPHSPGESDAISTVERWREGGRNDTPFHSAILFMLSDGYP